MEVKGEMRQWHNEGDKPMATQTQQRASQNGRRKPYKTCASPAQIARVTKMDRASTARSSAGYKRSSLMRKRGSYTLSRVLHTEITQGFEVVDALITLSIGIGVAAVILS